MKVGESKKSGIYATIFAAGLAAGGGGAEALRDPDPTSYIAAGIVEIITQPCEDAKQPEVCEQLRDWQLGLVIDDLKPDVGQDDKFALGKLDLYVSERITFDDPVKEVWVQDALVVLNARLADGYARQDIRPDDTLSGEALVAMLEAARDA